MLPKRARLTAVEVKEVLARGRGRRGAMLSVKIQEAPPPFRCAVVVSKKVARSAVKRNQLRRAVYRALGSISLPPAGRAILFVQSVPQSHAATAFTSDIKKLLYV